MVLVFGWVVGPGHVDGLTFVWVEFHTPLIFPSGQVVEVILDDCPIIMDLEFTVEDYVISKEFGAGLDMLTEIIDEDKEQNWSYYCTL